MEEKNCLQNKIICPVSAGAVHDVTIEGIAREDEQHVSAAL
jgi:hypothetical protein